MSVNQDPDLNIDRKHWLFPGEILWIARRQGGFLKADYCKRFGVSATTLGHWEDGKRPIPEDVVLPEIRFPLLNREHYAIRRRRAGLSCKDLAGLIGCDRRTVIEAESGLTSERVLRNYWERQK